MPSLLKVTSNRSKNKKNLKKINLKETQKKTKKEEKDLLRNKKGV